MEADPGTFDTARLRQYMALGLTRFSVGVQAVQEARAAPTSCIARPSLHTCPPLGRVATKHARLGCYMEPSVSCAGLQWAAVREAAWAAASRDRARGSKTGWSGNVKRLSMTSWCALIGPSGGVRALAQPVRCLLCDRGAACGRAGLLEPGPHERVRACDSYLMWFELI